MDTASQYCSSSEGDSGTRPALLAVSANRSTTRSPARSPSIRQHAPHERDADDASKSQNGARCAVLGPVEEQALACAAVCVLRL